MRLVPATILIALIAACSAKPEGASWSESVNGLQGRIEMKETKVVNETPIVSVYLTLRNVSDIGSPIKLDWDKAKVSFRVTDERGNELRGGRGPYDGPVFALGTLVLPHDSVLTFNLSCSGLGIDHDKAALIDLGFPYTWTIDRRTGHRFFLTMTLSAEDREKVFFATRTAKNKGKPLSAEEKEWLDRDWWHGQIETPRVEIPIKE